jgi:hypothetical protein
MLRCQSLSSLPHQAPALTGFANSLGFESMEFTIIANGVEILDSTFRSLAVAESFFRDTVIDLGSNWGGPDVDLTFDYNLVADGSGGFGFDLAVGGTVSDTVPEPSTWAMMLLGFAGLAFAGRAKAGHAIFRALEYVGDRPEEDPPLRRGMG